MTLMTLKQAEQIREDFDYAVQGWHECQAEAGMGAVSMGFDGYDGMSDYAQRHPMPVATPEVLEADRVAGMFYGLSVEVPEYHPHGNPSDSLPF